MASHTERSIQRSRSLFDRAQELFPGGVNSPVRAFGSVGGTPRFITSASGSCVTDADGNTYIDYVSSWGPLIAGHAHPNIVQAVQEAAAGGTSFGAPTEQENELAALVMDRMDSIERIRFVSSGTEAGMSALRVARAATGRNLVLKFDGCYHGHADSLLVSAGSGALTLGQPDSAGVPEAIAQTTLSVPYNDIEAVEAAFTEHCGDIAAIIVEPVAGNMGVIEPGREYLQALRDITSRHGALLIFDEVITGFRVARGGAQERYGVTPDLTILGKIIGGGLPVGAYGGRKDLMDYVAPVGPVYQAGTLAGNPLAMSAGIATLHLLDGPGIYEQLEHLGSRLEEGLNASARQAEVPATVHRVGSMMTMFFADHPVTDFATAKQANTQRYAQYFTGMLERGVYFAPSQYECGFLTTVHTADDIDATIAEAESTLQAMIL